LPFLRSRAPQKGQPNTSHTERRGIPVVKQLQADDWTVETTRKHAQNVSDTPEPPEWADRERITVEALHEKYLTTALQQEYRQKRQHGESLLAVLGVPSGEEEKEG